MSLHRCYPSERRYCSTAKDVQLTSIKIKAFTCDTKERSIYFVLG
jgi:hypothetical protein